MSIPVDTPTVASLLASPLEVGEPEVRGPLAVFPVFGPEPVLEYRSFAQAQADGVVVKELGGGASVRDLLVDNPTPGAVLLFEGEEVLGAQQNRTFDVSVLVPPRSTLQVPVSCVEAGRWDGSRHGESFRPAPQSAHPELRRRKNLEAMRSLEQGMGPRADQGGTWQEVREKASRMAAHAPTEALHDVFEGHRVGLDDLTRGIEPKPNQQGALVAIGGRFVVLDRVSRPDVWRALHAPLLQGYALDALEAEEAPAPTLRRANNWLDRLGAQQVQFSDGIGLGVDVRFASRRVRGAALVCGEELIQVTAFASDGPRRGGYPDDPLTRIRRPSRRR